MHHDGVRAGLGGRAHDGAPYPRSPKAGRRRRWGSALLLLGLWAGVAGAEPRRLLLEPGAAWRTFEVRVPGRAVPFALRVVAGCRYRLTVEPLTLPRALLELGPPGHTRWRADSAPPAEPPAEGPPAEEAGRAVLTWDAERDESLEARVKGFSAQTGRARARLETIGPDGRPVEPHRRVLAVGGTLARVGELWIGEPNHWDLVLDAGREYEVRTLPGTAGRVSLALLEEGGEVRALAVPAPHAPFPALRFRAPDPALPPLRLEVFDADHGGGTYGVRLVEAEGGARRDEEPAATPPLRTGLLAEVRLGFQANPGDVAVLYLPRSSPYDPHALQIREGTRWTHLPRNDLSAYGERASMRTPERAALVWFRAHRAGTYRFLEPRVEGIRLLVHPAAEVRGAPLLLGTGLDPSVLARGGRDWKTVGLAVCMPGWPYVFAAARAGRGSVGLRVVDSSGRVRARRGGGLGLTYVPGVGPSVRFRVREPTVMRLQVRGRGWEGYALLRRAAN